MQNAKTLLLPEKIYTCVQVSTIEESGGEVVVLSWGYNVK